MHHHHLHAEYSRLRNDEIARAAAAHHEGPAREREERTPRRARSLRVTLLAWLRPAPRQAA